MTRRKLFADALTAAGIDLQKDYFALSSTERNKVEEIRRAFHYYGKKRITGERIADIYEQITNLIN